MAITQAMSLTGMFQWGMRQWSELENNMTSVERVVEYTEVEQETRGEEVAPQKTWPEHGQLEFKSVYLRLVCIFQFFYAKITCGLTSDTPQTNRTC